MKFESPHDGTVLMMTPEKSMQIQNAIGLNHLFIFVLFT